MNRDEFINFTSRFKGMFEAGKLNEIGQSVGLCKRLRVITPYRLGVLLVSLFATRRVETIADIQRGFSALFGESVEYKPFHNQLRKPGFAEFMREMVSELLSAAIVKVLRPKRGGVLSKFRRVVIQDGSSFAIKDNLREVFPGRFRTVSPAAVELHATYSLFEESMERIVLRPDSDSEQLELPSAQELKGALFFADRGYMNLPFFRKVVDAGGNFVVRGKCNLNPRVTKAYTESGRKLKKYFDKPLKRLRGLTKDSVTDLDVIWENVQGKELSLRIVVFWSPKEKRHQYLVTNLERDQYSASEILELYSLRWQIELVFKEWKSYANLHAFDTKQPAIAEGLIWAAIAAAICKRFFAHATQILLKVETSTRKVAMCFSFVFDKIVDALILDSNSLLQIAFEDALVYLALNATRAHPKRDRERGRLAFGLQPVFGNS